ncbi:hypothetical protein ACJW31_07G078600 [Castanea mollissima]
MSLCEYCHRILIALITAVGWFGGGMLRQEPPLSNSYSPKISHSTNPQCNVIQSASANHSTIKQNNASGPVARTNVAQHPARQGNSESSPRTEHGPNWVGLVRSPETQTQPRASHTIERSPTSSKTRHYRIQSND